MKNNNAIFPGTFDPITKGHVDLIERASFLFPTVVVGIAENTRKAPFFSIDERKALVADALKHLPNVKVEGFSTLLIEFAKTMNARVIIRGLRAVSDFEYEFQLANMNRRLDQQIETVFLTPGEQYSFVSSTLVKEIAQLKGEVGEFVPANVEAALKAKYRA